MKQLILEALHKIAQKQGVITVPQDYSKEFGQTGSGKAIFGKPQMVSASEADIRKTKERINDSIEVAKAYRNAYMNGTPDETGNVPFKVMYQGRVYDAKIPPQFFSDKTAGDKETDYMYYFNVPEIGDGAMQIKYDKRGYGDASVVRSKTDIPFDPNLGSAADAGYSKDYEGRNKYVTVKVGVRGKYQGEAKFYSVFPSPAMDAKIKADIAFRTEILDFMKGGGDYTTDDKGAEISNTRMDLDTKLQKVRKDAEMIIGKPLASNSVWLSFKDELKQKGDFDAQQMTQQLLQMLKGKGVEKKSEIGMSPDERAEWEAQQKEKLARIAAAKARMKRLGEQNVEEINLAKGIASLGLAASLATTPNKTVAQIPQTQTVNSLDTADITTLPNDKAAMQLLRSFRKNPFSAEDWAKQNRESMHLFKILKKMLDYHMNTGRLEQEDLDRLGAKYKTSSIAMSFLNRDEKTYTMREDDIA